MEFADDLTLSLLVKGIKDQVPQEVQNILSWAQDHLMTINLTKTKEMDTFDIKQEEFIQEFRCLVPFLAKQRGIHVRCICTYYECARKYGYSLDSLHHLFHSLIIHIFTYGISVWGVAS